MKVVRKLTHRISKFCWDCRTYRNEWINLRVFIERRGRCFYCRMDRLDEKYGASASAEMYKQFSRDKKYRPVPPTAREFRRYVMKCIKSASS